MEKYHGFIVNVSLEVPKIIENLKIIGSKKSWGWILYKIEFGEKELKKMITFLQENMKPEFYFHIYKDKELIVGFKKKIFKITTDKKSWEKAIKYGISLGIPKRQLDFFPCKIEDEKY